MAQIWHSKMRVGKHVAAPLCLTESPLLSVNSQQTSNGD